MPYITQEARNELAQGRKPVTSGELNYSISILCRDYIRTIGTSYSSYNDCIGALEGAKLEIYRRLVAPYEDTKVDQNGDIYV